jgi:hypothetical protein
MIATTWTYIRSEPGLWTVGFYDPSGDWQPDSDHSSGDEAAKRVHYLNGGDNEILAALSDLVARCDGAEGVRADGSNIQTMAAHAVLEKHAS